VMLVAALAWPTTGRAAAAAASEPAAPTAPTPAPSPVDDASSEPPVAAPKVELTPEELAQRQLELRLERADLHWLEAERLFQNGRYAEAALEFDRSYAAVPAAATLYGMALSYERAGKPVEAVRAYERYLALPDCPADVPPEQRPIDCATERSKAEQARAEQRRRVGELAIALGEGVELREVRVAGRTVPLDDFPLLLLPGTVDVEVFGLQADQRRSRPAYITPGEVTTFYVAPFEPEVVPRPVVTPDVRRDDELDAVRQERRQRQLRGTFWAGLGLTAAAGIATGVTGGIALYHYRRFQAELCGEPCVRRDESGEPLLDEETGDPIPLGGPDRDLYPHDHRAGLERHRPIANALLGVTVGLAVGTALVGSFAFRKRPRDPARAGKAPVRPYAAVGATGLVVRW